ncbi:MAG: hypothetical protein LBI57_02580, partial [Helicobacteraceae bacterium]|nr:hypothetical protein [Helicobacteraceae bacterium]
MRNDTICARLIWRFAALIALSGLASSLFAITMTIDAANTGVRLRDVDPIAAATLTAPRNIMVHAQAKATLSDSTGADDNWGCTKVQIGSQAPVYFDHANSRLEVGRSRVFVSPNLRAPIAAGT